jgi:hypothetical protein
MPNHFLVASRRFQPQDAAMDSEPLPEQRMPQTADEIGSYLFIKCIVTLVQTADVLMGKVEAPATGQPVMDLARVQLIIKQLELLDENAVMLGIEEQQMVKQSLQELRMAYVSAAGKTPEEDLAGEEETPPEPAAPADDDDDDDDEPSRTRFVKKYS